MYCIIKRYIVLVVLLISIFSFSNTSFAIKWGDLDSSQKSEIIQYADTQDENEIVEVCKYFEKGKQVGSEDPKVKYLFIYTDNTATVGWDDSTGVNREVTNSNNKAMDGYRETPGGTLYRGVRNWSANKGKNNGNDGVVVSANDSNDAYSGYSSSGKCSAYMVQRAFGSSNFFWLSPDSSDSMYKKTISNEYADMSDKNGTHTIYFNIE